MLLVDDTPFKAQQNYGNAIYIAEYLGQSHDAELPLLLRYLLSLRDAPTVRPIEKRDWRLRVQP